MGSDIPYRNLQAMQKVEVGTQVAITYYYKSFINLTSVYGYKFKGYKMKNNQYLSSIPKFFSCLCE